jgi:hypothetical protein
MEYVYWNVGKPKPAIIPEGCEYKTEDGLWKPEWRSDASGWDFYERRWPKPSDALQRFKDRSAKLPPHTALHRAYCEALDKAEATGTVVKCTRCVNGLVTRFGEMAYCPTCGGKGSSIEGLKVEATVLKSRPGPAPHYTLVRWPLIKQEEKKMLTKSEYDEALNREMVIYEKLPAPVKYTLSQSGADVQYYTEHGTWGDKSGNYQFGAGTVYRINPTTAVKPDLTEYQVNKISVGSKLFYCIDDVTTLHAVIGMVGFIGIMYMKNGVETLYTTLDPDHGIPTRVLIGK